MKEQATFLGLTFTRDYVNQVLLLYIFPVAYSADEVLYVWQLPKNKAVDYEGKLQLSQFDIMETAFRGLNYSRGNNSNKTAI